MSSFLEGEAFDVDVTAGDSGGADVANGGVGHAGRPADVDVALGEIGDELAQVLGREQPRSLGRRVVADEEVDGDAALGRELLDLAAEHEVVVGEGAVEDDDVAARAPRMSARTGVMPMPPATSAILSPRRLASVKTPNGPSARTRVPTGSDASAPLWSPSAFTVIRSDRPSGAAESENGCARPPAAAA